MKIFVNIRFIRILQAIIFVVSSFIYILHFPHTVFANDLSPNMVIDKTSLLSAGSGTDTISFDVQSTATLKEIDILYTTTSTGSTKPQHLDITGTSLGTVSGINGSWTFSNANSVNGILSLTNTSGQSFSVNDPISIQINTVVNPTVGDCAGTSYYDTCYIQVKTYSDAGITLVDNGAAAYTFSVDPSLSFTISGVNSATTTNGITTTATTTSSTIPFGDVIPGQVAYAAQQLTVTTNAPSGYDVYMRLTNQLQGTYTTTYVSPFAGSSASWSSPQTWSDPTGTTNGTDTAWFGVNTSDTRVTGWSSGSGKFAPCQTSNNKVMTSTGPDTNKSIYLTYGFEANQYHDPDVYSGTLIYLIIPKY